MPYTYLIVDNGKYTVDIEILMKKKQNFLCLGIVPEKKASEAINQLAPHLVLTAVTQGDFSLDTIREMYQYTERMPYIIAVSDQDSFALKAIQSGVSDYILAPFTFHDIAKSLFLFEKRSFIHTTPTLCIKSYSDYSFVSLEEIAFLKADNNTTDLIMSDKKTITAYKPLKHFEDMLPLNFLRIHKSYIVNIRHVSRIHLSKARCYLNDNMIIPFSDSYRSQVEALVPKLNT